MKKIFLILLFLMAVSVSYSWAAARPDSKKGMYWVVSIAELQALDPTGAGTPNIYDLIEGDSAILVGLSGVVSESSIYVFDASGTDAEDSPNVIRPTNYTTGVWRRNRGHSPLHFLTFENGIQSSAQIHASGGESLDEISEDIIDALISSYGAVFAIGPDGSSRMSFWVWDATDTTAEDSTHVYPNDTDSTGNWQPTGLFGLGDITTAGYISGQALVAPDTSGVITLTVNAVNYGTDTGKANIPDGACNAADDVGNWVCLISSAADAYQMTSDDESNQFTVTDNASAFTANYEMDIDGTMACVMCIAAELWKVTGYMGAIPTDGGAP